MQNYNRRLTRGGSGFQVRYKGILIEKQKILRYVVLNSIWVGMVKDRGNGPGVVIVQ